MTYVPFGSSSLKVSRIALGAMGIGDPAWRSWVLDERAARPLLHRAIEHGINFIDTCDYYSAGASEEVVGRILQDMKIRDQIVIATKLGNPMGAGPNDRGYSRKHIIDAAEASLRRLGTDRIDLYQTHIWDSATNIEEMVEAFDFLVRQGKVLYVGATDIPCWQLARAVYHARHNHRAAFVSLQHHYNAVWREDERDLMPFCRAEGLALLPYSPIARGFLAGRRRRNEQTTERARSDEYAQKWYGRPADADVADVVDGIAQDHGVEPAQVALAWVLSRSPAAVPIIGATQLEHIDAAMNAVGMNIDAAALKRVDAAYASRARGGHS